MSSLAILYQDDWIVAVDKPAGQLVHPTASCEASDEITMKILRDQIGQRVHVIHRLDRPTSGVLLFAIDQDVARALHLAFKEQAVEKVYWAIVNGQPEQSEWACQEPIRKDGSTTEQTAETQFRVLQALHGELALVEARPRSGRFHQIRRHLLHAGHPIVGDYRYAGVERSEARGAELGTGTRMLLQARRLRLCHPITGNELSIKAPVDAVIGQVLRSH